MAAGDHALRQVLERARALGFLGPPEVAAHLAHAEGFARAYHACAGDAVPATAADLGSGGGIPALPLAQRWPRTTWTLIESGQRRATFLAEAVATLDLAARVQILNLRAEEAGQDPAMRGAFALVTARAFGPPPITAECGSPLLTTGGILIVSDPPGGGDVSRWPAQGLRELGLRHATSIAGPPAFTVLQQDVPCPVAYPRGVGVPAKRPLWTTG